jgi:hypothetical protein
MHYKTRVAVKFTGIPEATPAAPEPVDPAGE